MKASKQAVDLIKRHESLQLDAYQCDGDKWTIGYGQTGAHIGPGLKITPFEAEEWLKNHISTLQDDITKLVKVKITQPQFDALVSLVYNIGITAFRHSTLLKKLNNNDVDGAAQEILRWEHSNGVKLEGLSRRRREEYHLFRA